MKILATDGIAKVGIDKLREGKCTVDEFPTLLQDELLRIIPKYDAILIRSKTKITSEIIYVAKALKIIGRAGVGVDNIDIESATQHGIVVVNTPTANSITTAEFTVAMIMGLVRNIPQASRAFNLGKCDRKDFIGHELHGKTLGIIGFGNVGKIVAKCFSTFGMSILAFDPFVKSDFIESVGVKSVDLPILFKQSDIITVHTPLTPDTTGLINADVIENQLKDGVFLVNCARAGIIDEIALGKALKTGKISGAAFDVLEGGSDNLLLQHDNFIALPHLGASTIEAQERASTSLAAQILEFITHGNVINAVNAPEWLRS